MLASDKVSNVLGATHTERKPWDNRKIKEVNSTCELNDYVD